MRHGEEYRADRREQEQGHPQRLLPRAGRCELRDTDREPERGDEKKRKMDDRLPPHREARSEKHTSELQSLMRISYAVFFLTKKTKRKDISRTTEHERKHK